MDETDYEEPQCTSATNGTNANLMIAGQILSPMHQITKIVGARHEIFFALSQTIQLSDLIFLSILGWFLVPVVQFFYELYLLRVEEKDNDIVSSTRSGSSNSVSNDDEEPKEPFFRSTTYHLCNVVSQLAKLGLLVYLMDCLVVVLDEANKQVSLNEMEISRKCAKIIYTTWAAIRLMSFKRYLLSVAANRATKKLGKLTVYDRIMDILILFSLTVTVLDVLRIDIGPGLTSLFAFGGVGTLVISLACQNMATQLVSGVAVSTSENFYVGDSVRLGDDTCGVIEKLGWFYTDIRGYDEYITRIPNQEFANRRICNISRMKKCQIKRSFRFRHQDLKKITPVCQQIKDNLKEEIEELISDGSRPFRVTLREVHEDHLLVVMDTHYNLPPFGDTYFNTLHKILNIVCLALRDNDVTLACKTYLVAPQSNDSKENNANPWFK